MEWGTKEEWWGVLRAFGALILLWVFIITLFGLIFSDFQDPLALWSGIIWIIDSFGFSGLIMGIIIVAILINTSLWVVGRR